MSGIQLDGDDQANFLQGGSDNDTLNGGAGDDTLDGREGADSMVGGTGDDQYWIDHPGDVVSEDPDAGHDFVFTTLPSYTLGENVEALELLGTGPNTGLGNDLDNYLTGNNSADTLDGGAGNDTLWDGFNGQAVDSLIGGLGDDTFYIHNAADRIVELAGQGHDIEYATVSCTLAANVEDLEVDGPGTAAINGTGNALANTIYGSHGANVLNGGAGNDSIYGGDASDTLVGGAGKDLLTGGGGLDHFNFATLSDSGAVFATRDVINTFAHGDRIDLSALDANAHAAGNQAFTFVDNFTHVAGQLEWTQTAASGYLIQGDTNGDGAADFSVQIYAAPGFGTVHSWDFIL